jgi:hypothetical protein
LNLFQNQQFRWFPAHRRRYHQGVIGTELRGVAEHETIMYCTEKSPELGEGE